MLKMPLFHCMILVWMLIAHPLWADEQARGVAYLLDVSGAIGPATADYIDRALTASEQRQAELVILRMDTPGGRDTSMRDIIKRIITAEIPVVSYVAPGGARAASAGTYILYASHVAAMAPGTNLGAATPVSLGGMPGMDKDQEKPKNGTDGEDAQPLGAKERKIINDAAAYIRGLARLRGRNAEWAEQAVREGVSLSASEALERQVIDLLASDVDELLLKLQGREVQLPHGSRTLHTQDLMLVAIEPDWRSEVLSILSNPNVAYILMLVGIYGLIYEFANPGAIVPGVSGAVALLLALYAFQVLPVNYAGAALILLGLALMMGEAFVPSFGALGIGGVIAFVVGSMILIETDQPAYGISLPLIFTVAICSAVLLAVVVGMALKSHRQRAVSGDDELFSAQGYAIDAFEKQGTVRVQGEIWDARSDRPLRKNQAVRVIGRNGLVLKVTPGTNEEESS